jgi:hypothetical protein
VQELPNSNLVGPNGPNTRSEEARCPNRPREVAPQPTRLIGQTGLKAFSCPYPNYDNATQVNHALWYISTPEERDAWVLPLALRSIFPQELLLFKTR